LPTRIQRSVAAEGVDLAALPPYHWKPDTVTAVRAAGADVSTRQVRSAAAARAAQAIDLIQGDDPFVIATHWCR
jgi:hypothetical protein